MIEEIIYNIMINYKQSWNHHVPGIDCWCKPILGQVYLAHRNYDWVNEQWVPIKEK